MGLKTRMTIINDRDGGIEFSGYVKSVDLQHLYMSLDRNDIGFLECCFDRDATSVQWLHGLELIFRRLQEHSEAEQERCARGIPIVPVK